MVYSITLNVFNTSENLNQTDQYNSPREMEYLLRAKMNDREKDRARGRENVESDICITISIFDKTYK